MLPLFPGMPGGLELLVIFVMMVILFGVPFVVILVGGAAWLQSKDDTDEERIERLEREVDELRAQQETGATASPDDAVADGRAGDGAQQTGDSADDRRVDR